MIVEPFLMAASIPAMTRKRSVDEEDTKGIKSMDADQEFYKNFPEVISERWQQEIAETVFKTINQEADKLEHNKKAKMGFDDVKDSDCIIHGYLKKLVASEWETRYGKLYPNRLELHTESSSAKPELIFMDQIEEVVADYVMVKGEQCIVLKMKAEKDRDAKIVLTNPDEIGLKEWLASLKSTYKNSLELLASIEEKALKIFQGLTIGAI